MINGGIHMKLEKNNTAENQENVKELTLEEKIMQWKKIYKKVFSSQIDGTEYIWHRISRKDYNDVMEINVGDSIEDKIYNRQVEIIKVSVLNMDEEEINSKIDELAGLASSLADEILNKSGFSIESTVELQ